MSTTRATTFRDKRTDETRAIEKKLGQFFPKTDAYRYNSASIRVRVIDDRFRGKSNADREEIVSPHLDDLPPDTQADITMLLLLSPAEAKTSIANLEFEAPSPSKL